MEYTEEQIEHWGLDTKQEMGNILVAARLSYIAMLQKGDKRQLLITDYWKWCTIVTSGVIPAGRAMLVDLQ